MKKLTAIVLSIVLFTLAGCSWLRSDTVTDGKNKAIDCATESLKQNALSIYRVVVAIVTGRADNWKQQLAALGKEFGRDTLACAVRLALGSLQEDVSLGTPADHDGVPATTAVGRANEFMQEQGYVYEEQ
jgi:hypothetical protein